MGVLRFGLFGFRIHVRPSFWLVAVLLLGSTQRSLSDGLTLVAVVFASILAHELGHAIVARRTGLHPVIFIHAFGGITSWQAVGPIARGRVIAIAIAGPSASLLLCGLAVAVLQTLPRVTATANSVGLLRSLVMLAEISGFWSFVNLLPIVPFDGGSILTHLLGPKRRGMAAHISLFAGLVASALLFSLGSPVLCTLVGLSALLHYVGFVRTSRAVTSVDADEIELLLTRASRALVDGDSQSASETAERAFGAPGATTEHRRRAAEIEAWAALEMGQPEKSQRVVEWLAQGPVDPLLAAAVLEVRGAHDQAITCLRQALVAGDDRPQVAASLVRLLLSANRFGEAALTTIEILDHVSIEEARLVVAACRDGGRPVPAAELSMALFDKTEQVDDLAWALVSYANSESQAALDSALSDAGVRHVSRQTLLSSTAFSAVPNDSELRRQVAALLD